MCIFDNDKKLINKIFINQKKLGSDQSASKEFSLQARTRKPGLKWDHTSMFPTLLTTLFQFFLSQFGQSNLNYFLHPLKSAWNLPSNCTGATTAVQGETGLCGKCILLQLQPSQRSGKHNNWKGQQHQQTRGHECRDGPLELRHLRQTTVVRQSTHSAASHPGLSGRHPAVSSCPLLPPSRQINR